jgi:hypothetical protein
MHRIQGHFCDVRPEAGRHVPGPTGPWGISLPGICGSLPMPSYHRNMWVGSGEALLPVPAHASCFWAVKVMVSVTLSSTIAILARFGGVIPKSLIKMVVVAVPKIVVPSSLP